ncbi:DUF2975 domain-containing protein [uncultured Polaribacter sp.]|uniref:DUF2975 domain-containing protein n=1 Tax=uncultured Polaribacter sp. TaxID=174711 RepID=UPI002601BDA4|nr:DUF2975 domain-containing protein [uncultured Polaribacter sp.]
MIPIFQTILYLTIFSLLSFAIYSIYKKKGLTTFLHGLFSLTFWGGILFLIIAISFTIFTDNDTIETSEKSKLYANTKNVPVRVFLSFNADTKLQFKPNSNLELSSNTDSLAMNSYLNLKTDNWVLSSAIFLNTYLSIIILIFIFFQLKSLFKILSTNLSFSLQLTKKINWIASLLIVWQLSKLIFSIIFGLYYGYVGLNKMQDQNINLSINPRLDIDFTIIIFALSLFVLGKLLKRAHEIQTENDLTI